MAAQIDEVVAGAAEAIARRAGTVPGAVIDLKAAFADVIPVAAISRITGIRPGEHQARFARLVHAVVEGAVPFAPDDRCQPRSRASPSW